MYMSQRSGKKSSPLMILLGILVVGAAVVLQQLGLFETEEPVSENVSGSAEAQVYFIDVGQGDSELIRLKDSGIDILIDAGTRSTKQELADYLKELGVDDIDILIGTHPHEDHIGGMAKIIEEFPIGTLYLPETSEEMTPTTKTYESLLDAAESKNVTVRTAAAGDVLLEQGNTSFKVLSPSHTDYDNLNDYSIVTRLKVGDTTFLFQGDAETPVEEEILDSGADVSCDVIKLGHHGSSTSSSRAYLEAANPSAAVISCGVGNEYGHPHRETMDLLEKLSITPYRTDTQKTLLAETDGKTIVWQTELESVIDAAS